MKRTSLVLSILLVILGLGVVAREGSAQEDPGFKVVINAANSTTQLDAKTVAKMFLKKARRWDDGSAVVPIDQDPSSEARKAFSKAVHGKSASAIESYWQRMIFSGRDSPPSKAPDDQEVLSRVAAEAGAIGYVASSTAFIDGVKELQVTASEKKK